MDGMCYSVMLSVYDSEGTQLHGFDGDVGPYEVYNDFEAAVTRYFERTSDDEIARLIVERGIPQNSFIVCSFGCINSDPDELREYAKSGEPIKALIVECSEFEVIEDAVGSTLVDEIYESFSQENASTDKENDN